MITDGQLQLSK